MIHITITLCRFFFLKKGATEQNKTTLNETIETDKNTFSLSFCYLTFFFFFFRKHVLDFELRTNKTDEFYIYIYIYGPTLNGHLSLLKMNHPKFFFCFFRSMLALPSEPRYVAVVVS